MVLSDGEVVHLGGDGRADAPGYDLLGAFVGSEGTLGVVTRVTVRVIAKPQAIRTLQAAFGTIDDAGGAVSDIIGAGIVPAAVEMMDPLAMEAAEAAVHVSYPPGAGAVLLVELDGPHEEVDHLFEQVERICHARAAFDIRLAQDDAERARIWKGRKSAFAAMGRIAPTTTSRTASCRARRSGSPAPTSRRVERAGLRVAQRLPRGRRQPAPADALRRSVDGERRTRRALAREILRLASPRAARSRASTASVPTRPRYMAKMFGADDLAVMQLVRCAFDPDGLANPGKVFPTPRLCGETPGPYRRHPLERAGVAERL